jgi:hypothetical protein
VDWYARMGLILLIFNVLLQFVNDRRPRCILLTSDVITCSFRLCCILLRNRQGHLLYCLVRDGLLIRDLRIDFPNDFSIY